MIGASISREARLLKLRLEAGLAGLDEIEAWADQRLLSETDAPSPFVTLAMARRVGPQTALENLDELFGLSTRFDILATASLIDVVQLSNDQIGALLARMAEWGQTIADTSHASEFADIEALLIQFSMEGEEGIEFIEEPRDLALKFFKALRELSST